MFATVAAAALSLVGLPQAGGGSQNSCGRIDDGLVSSYVERSLAGPGEQLADELSQLLNYWDSRCILDRRHASQRTVSSISRLLSRQRARLAAVRMLVDVGETVRFSRHQLRLALADQRRIEAAEVNDPMRVLAPSPVIS